MFFSQRMPIRDFIYEHFKRDKNYRLSFNTKDNSCVFADLEYIKVPSFKNCMPIPLGQFADMMMNRKVAWQNDSRFYELYVYVIETNVYVFDRDNIEIENFAVEFNKAQEEYKSAKRPVFQAMA